MWDLLISTGETKSSVNDPTTHDLNIQSIHLMKNLFRLEDQEKR